MMINAETRITESLSKESGLYPLNLFDRSFSTFIEIRPTFFPIRVQCDAVTVQPEKG